jgi:ribonuclease HI
VVIDGRCASRDNPGEAGWGAVILDENAAVVKELSRY